MTPLDHLKSAQAKHIMVFLVAGKRPWNRDTWAEVAHALPEHRWEFVDGSGGNAQLAEAADRESPAAVFFLSWPWKVPAEFVARHRCVNFHAAPLPFGRGGSIVQHLILSGWPTTTLVAHRMVAEIDAGPILLAREVSLDGSAEQVYMRIDRVAAKMIAEIVRTSPAERPQEGEMRRFPRRTPDQSDIRTAAPSLDAAHDFIRMLDAEGYPPAFLDLGPLRLTFRRAARYRGRVEADVTIRVREEAGP